ncbi:MAG: primosomal protein N' [candidate division Zixibacteria bacterium]|nr:primosomal protein N' [candidate division Zixibacteria bacterium]
MQTLVHIALPGTPRRLFTYRCPSDDAARLSSGQRIYVPFGNRKSVGFFIGPADKTPDGRLKNIIEILDRQSLFSQIRMAFLGWMAEYYFAGIADVLQAALPPELRKVSKPVYLPTGQEISASEIPESVAALLRKRGAIRGRNLTRIEKQTPGLIARLTASGHLRESWVDPTASPAGVLQGYRYEPEAVRESKLTDILRQFESQTASKTDIIAAGIRQYTFRKLIKQKVLLPVYGPPDILPFIKPRDGLENIIPTDEQQSAIGEVLDARNGFTPFLLYGITGSGKTLVYCHLVREALEQGKTALVLVPEIALAGTLLAYFRGFFPNDVAIMHSALKPSERLQTWQHIKNGDYRVVIGARSAIFAPLDNPGVIIVDEEHDESYKQDDPAPRFQARDAAVMMAKLHDIPIVLGSATPSLESFHNAETGRYRLLKLTRRPEQAAFPVIKLVDLKKERPARDDLFFTKTMTTGVRDTLERQQQVILYLNRRGFSPRIKCAACGHTPTCPQCEVSLTYHRHGNKLMCHLCGLTRPALGSCEKCNSTDLIHFGTGTQKIEERIADLFETASLVRLDSDSAGGRVKSHFILNDFARKKYNVLLGTQMVTKGIDFPDVSLVGVLMADIGLDMPDFRASEKLFAKLIQVSGRSGRGIIPGEVILQTFNPELDLIDDAARQDYDTFYQREAAQRQALQYPPFAHLINFRLYGKNEDTLAKQAKRFKTLLEHRIASDGITAIVLGPAPCPLYRVRGQYRRQMVAKTNQTVKLIQTLTQWEAGERNFGIPSNIRLIVDVDPYDMM